MEEKANSPGHAISAMEWKDARDTLETEQVDSIQPVGVDDAEALDAYKMSWRTICGVLVLSLAWGASTGGVVGPNSSIGYMVETYPAEANSASWVANTGLFFLVTLPAIIGAASDRYGKKWFLIVGALLGIVGATISAEATSMKMIIGGQAFSGIAGAMLIVSVAAGMEIVPAKERLVVISLMAILNGLLGPTLFTLVFAACQENGMTWRWGFKILAIMYAVVVVSVMLLYNPPPTRFRRQQTLQEMLKSIDFIGIGLLALGSAFLTIGLVWGGSAYPWGSSHVVPFLVIGPLILVGFCIYEWKGRPDGIMHHAFFRSPSFPIFMLYGFVDGVLLYGLSVYIPDETRAIFTSTPLPVGGHFMTYEAGLLVGYPFFGFLASKLKQFRWPLVSSSLFLTLFVGLMARVVPSNVRYFDGMLFFVGFFTSATEVIPIAGVGLLVPSHLIATSTMVLSVLRALGGTMGISILSAIYANKAAVYVPQHVIPVLEKAGIPSADFTKIITIVLEAPALLAKIPGLTPATIDAIVTAGQEGSAKSYQSVWYAIMAASAACLALSVFIVDAPEKMTKLVESALEPSKLQEEQRVHM